MAGVTIFWQALGYTVAGNIVLAAGVFLWAVLSTHRVPTRIWNEVMDGDDE